MINVYPIVFEICDRQCIKDHLDKYGYVAIRVLSKNDVKNLKSKFKSWYFNLHPNININSWNTLPDQVAGIIKGYKVGHTNFMWDIRNNICVNYVYQLIYNSKERMVPSYDGCTYYPKNLGTNSTAESLWPHIDKNPYMNTLLYQSAISLESNMNENDGGFVCWEKTHYLDTSFYSDIVDPDKEYPEEFFRIPHDAISDIKPKILRVPKGTMIVWNSSLIHCNLPPSKNAVHDRLVAYVCMVPISMLSIEQFLYLQKLKNHKKTTTHSPLHPRICHDNIFYNKDTIIKYEKTYKSKKI
jgi:hypothetical protein